MTRDDLLSAMAKAQYESAWGYEDHTSWEALHPDTRHVITDVMLNNQWPLIVAFVSAWLESTGSAASFLSECWHRDMGA